MASNLLISPDFVCFTTRSFALSNNQSLPAASRSLGALARRKIITRVTKGIWANTKHPYYSPLSCVFPLLGAEQGYISFLTALHRHGAISQIPRTIQIATTGHSRKVESPIGTFEFFQLKPHMMKEGVEWSESKIPYRIAQPEKALIDTLYLSSRRGKRFSSLPELDFHFDDKKIRQWVKKLVPNRLIRLAIESRLEEILKDH